MKKTLLIIFSSLWMVMMLYAQENQEEKYYSGLLLNDSAYALIPEKPILLTRSYNTLPKSHLLKQYCPAIGSQGNHGTCTGWAAAYAARTITEAVINQWKTPVKTTAEAFSPLFVYSLIRGENSANCQRGIYLDAAFEILKKRGVVKYDDFNYYCSASVTISNELHTKARAYTIDNYFALFSLSDSYAKKINTTKKSIAENRPVVISMANFISFQKNNEEVWSGITDTQDGYHAMCVVAYDDNKYGGAFLLMNSWGTRWGSGGFKWVRYTDYSQHVNYAMEMYVREKRVPTAPQPPRPQPVPTATTPSSSQPEFVNLAGEVHFVLSTGQKMRSHLRFINNIPYYTLAGSYVSGTRYRLYVSNNEPAYVYVIGSDLANSVSKVFPPNDLISAALVYKSNDIAIPDEKWYIEMDNTIGKDYACILYSRDELPIDDIVKEVSAESGSFFEKVYKALRDKTVPVKDIKYDSSSIKFRVKNTSKIVVPIIVEIDHH